MNPDLIRQADDLTHETEIMSGRVIKNINMLRAMYLNIISDLEKEITELKKQIPDKKKKKQ